jgi:Tfp pilus assembly protein PilN
MRAVNLIPSDERRRGGSVGAGRSQGIAYVVLGVLAGIAVLVVLYGVARHHASSRRSQLATIAAETQRAHEAVAALTPYTSFIALREARMKAVADVVDSRFDWAHAFHELGRVLPRDTSITSLDGTVGAPGSASGSSSSSSSPAAAGSATPVGSVPTITLGGCAGSQSEVALTLQRLRLIDGVGDVSLKSSTKGGGSASSSASGQCAPKSPSFSVEITFDPLPAATSEAASKTSTQLTASTGGGQ